MLKTQANPENHVVAMSPVSPELLGSLLDKHGAGLRLYARQFFASDREAADDDAVQDALIGLARLEAVPDDPVAWLFRVVRNRALSIRRSQLRRRRHETSAAAPHAPWFEPRDDDRLDAAAAADALRALSEELREIVAAHLWGGLTFKQIAAVTGTSAGTAHRRYEAGLRELRRRLEPLCPTDT